MSADARIARIAQVQHGLITIEQSLDAGLTSSGVGRRAASGRWVPKRRGVYAIAGTPPSERQEVLAVVLATNGCASHTTAARLWGLQFPRSAQIHVLGRFARLDGVVAHRSATLVDADVSRLGGIPLTSPARTIVDCSGTVPLAQLGAVVDDALRRGLVRLEELRRCHERVATGPGRRPTVALRSVLLERAPGYEAGDSQREADIVRLLANSGLPAPVLGHRVTIGRHRYKLDIAWPEARLAIEFDGWDIHRTFTAFHRDRQRGRRIASAGWTILPVTAHTDLHELIGDVTRLLLRDSVRSAG